MLALAVYHHGPHVGRQAAEEGLDAAHHRVVERVALFRPCEAEHGERALPLGAQRGGQVGKGGG